MKWKNTLILFSVFLVLLAIIYIFEIQGTKKREAKEEYEKLLLKVDKDSVVEYSLKNEKDTLTVRKSNGKWDIVSPFFAEGDNKKIQSNLESILESKIERTIVQNLTDLEPYGLHKPRGEVTVVKSDSSKIRLLIGDENPTGSFIYVKYPEKPDIYTTKKSLWSYVNKSIYDLRDKQILHFDKDNVRKIDLFSKKYGKIIIEKIGEDKWQITEPIKYPARSSTVRIYLNSLTGNKAKEFVDEDPQDLKKYGLKNPLLIVNCYVGEELTKATLIIGDSLDGSSKFYAKEESRKPVFTIQKYVFRNLNKDAFYFQEKKISGYDGKNADSIIAKIEDEEFACVRDTNNHWIIVKPDTIELEKSRINNWLNGIRDFIVDKLVTYKPKGLKTYGLDYPSVKIALFNKGKKVESILVGKKNDDYYYTKNESYPYVYKIKEYKVKRLLKKINDLKKSEEKDSKSEK